MGLAPWGALGGGAFKTAEQRKAQEGRKIEADENQIKISEVLEKVAKRKNTALTSIALAYVMHKTPYVFPLVGGRKIEHLRGNIEALHVRLSKEDIQEIEGAVAFDVGFPASVLYPFKEPEHPSDVWALGLAATYDYVGLPQAITPPEK